VAIRVWRAGDHEIAETVLRVEHEPGERLILEAPAGKPVCWRVLSVQKDPHGWRTTATRCLPGCREHPVITSPGD
jgi:hypothetical protein